jgi:hypothetical protein
MKPRSGVEIEIRELVVEGYSRREAARIEAAVRRELAREFAGGVEGLRSAHPDSPVRIEVPARGDFASRVGRGIADATRRTGAGLAPVDGGKGRQA